MEKVKRILAVSILGIGALSLFFWGGFVFCFFLALGSDGSLGAIIESGVYLLKHLPIVAGASIGAALIFASKMDKIFN
ncbi:MAG: hypothetical protein WCW65_03345 [Candidatus Paceibacterota bacterium]